ncbi:hypothetical protein HMPREF0185_03269 [Brevundimonas diminuta 470-4]|nr:hypothetical protein HMPREF0185_03269 [Brevundimonas diminuta 470-4]
MLRHGPLPHYRAVLRRSPVELRPWPDPAWPPPPVILLLSGCFDNSSLGFLRRQAWRAPAFVAPLERREAVTFRPRIAPDCPTAATSADAAKAQRPRRELAPRAPGHETEPTACRRAPGG